MLLTVESFHIFHLFASVFAVFVPFCFLHCDKQSFSFEIFSSTAAACKTWILDAKWCKDSKSQRSLTPMLQPKTLLYALTKHRKKNWSHGSGRSICGTRFNCSFQVSLAAAKIEMLKAETAEPLKAGYAPRQCSHPTVWCNQCLVIQSPKSIALQSDS